MIEKAANISGDIVGVILNPVTSGIVVLFA